MKHFVVKFKISILIKKVKGKETEEFITRRARKKKPTKMRVAIE